MKFTLLLLFCSLFQLKAEVFSQRKVSVQMSEVTLDRVFQELGRQAKCDFLYNHSLVKQKGNVTISVEDRELNAVLDELLPRLGMEYVLDENVIIIREKWALPQNQDVEVRGTVRDEKGTSLPGVTVVIKGTTLGTATDDKGKFVLRLPRQEGITLVFSYVGMKLEEVKFTGQKDMQVVLYADEQEMEEVVVTGYQVIDKRYVTSAITTVNAADVLVPGMTSIDQALEGRVPELLLMSNSGEVGATPRIRIRGTSTLLGNREPLWVLDGFILQDPVDVSNEDLNNPDYINIIGNAIAGINPQDIERIDVLKDASATALYGTRAANGVIVVTTKKGKVGPACFSYNHTSKFTRRPRYTDRNINLMNSKERVLFGKNLSDTHYQFPSGMTMVGYEGALYRYYSGLTDYNGFLDEVKRYETINTDWFDILTRDSYSHDHTLSVSGGADKFRYYASIGYNYDEGVTRTTSTQRYTSMVNLNFSLSDKLKADLSINGSVQKKNHLQDEIKAMDYAYNTTRALPCYNEDGSLFYYDKVAYDGMNQYYTKYRYNILNEIDNSSNSYDGSTLSASLNLNYNVLEALSLRFAGYYSKSSTLQEDWWGEKSHYVARLKNGEYEDVPLEGEIGECILPYGGVLNTNNSIAENYTLRLQYDFRKTIGVEGVHLVASTGGFEVNSNTTRSISDENRGYVKDRGLQFVDGIDLEKFPHYANWLNKNHRTIRHNVFNQLSGYLTLSYSYMQHFTVYANGRVDASNKFGSSSNDKFLPIWAVSGNWNLKENILKGCEFISDMSLRSSFGMQGNMLEDQSPNLIISQGVTDVLYNENISTIARYPNPNLQWEKTRSFNLGLDVSFLDSRLTLDGSFYSKRTEDCFTEVQVSSVNGINTYMMNGGDLKNDGFSIGLSATPVKNKKWYWRFSTYYSANLNQVQSGTVESYTLSDYLNGTALVDGESIGTFYSYKFLGLNPENGAPLFDDYADRQHLLQGKSLEETVRMVMENSGTREPKFSGSFSNTLTYKGWSWSMNLSYSLGSKIRLFPLYSPIMSGVSSELNVRKEFVDRWQVPGDERRTNIPVLMSRSNVDYSQYSSHFSSSPLVATRIQNFASSYWDMYDKSNIRVVSGNYLKCSSMSLRYTFNSNFLAKTPFSSMTASLNAMNLFTISAKELKGQDPSQAGFATPNLSIRPSYTFQFSLIF